MPNIDKSVERELMLLQVLEASGPLTLAELASLTGVPKISVRLLIGGLEDADVVKRSKFGQKTLWGLADLN
jgi:DNA-binding IclR family transcriptional regulator